MAAAGSWGLPPCQGSGLLATERDGAEGALREMPRAAGRG